jgi:lipoprotein-anchoring transpeptidase ErfK/SrfK
MIRTRVINALSVLLLSVSIFSRSAFAGGQVPGVPEVSVRLPGNFDAPWSGGVSGIPYDSPIQSNQPLHPYDPESTGTPCPLAAKVDRTNAPDGFGRYIVRNHDSVLSVCGDDPARQWLFLKVNRIDRHHLPVGKSVLVPVEMERARLYVPVPISVEERGRLIVVYLESQCFGVYEGGKLLSWGPVSTGRDGKNSRKTPRGKYRIEQKYREWTSEIKGWTKENDLSPLKFGFFMLISRSLGVNLHWGPMEGYPASHGCIRMLLEDANMLFAWTCEGDQVWVI